MIPVTQAAAPQNLVLEQADCRTATPAEMDDARVADWLRAHPDFFELHADLLAEVRIRHPHGVRAISLVERQVLVLRERNKALASKMAELIRIGQENDGIDNRLQQLTRNLLCTGEARCLPQVLLDGMRSGFEVPQVAIRLWGIEGVEAPFGDDVSAALRRRADELNEPYCGPNAHAEAAGWLAESDRKTASMAMLTLRATEASVQGRSPPLPGSRSAFGLLVLGSDDAGRFQAGMGTAFLGRIAQIAGASLSRLLG